MNNVQNFIMIYSGAEESGHVHRPFMAINSSMGNIARALDRLPEISSPSWAGEPPAAIAAGLICPDRPVGCFPVTATLMMTSQEMAILSHHGGNIIILLFNNSMYGTIRMHQERNFTHRVIGTDLTNPDFTAFDRSFGIYGVAVRKTVDFAPAFAQAFTLIEIMVDAEALTPAATLEQIRTTPYNQQEKS